MDFPSSQSGGQIVTVGRLFFGHRHFLEGEDVMCCRWSVLALLFPCIRLPAIIGNQSGIVFFKCHSVWKWGSESWSKWNGRANGSAHFLEPSWEHSVKVKRFSFIFSGAWCPLFFFSSRMKLRGAFVLWARCICCFCFYCVFVVVAREHFPVETADLIVRFVICTITFH